jgi:hypothetical protein
VFAQNDASSSDMEFRKFLKSMLSHVAGLGKGHFRRKRSPQNYLGSNDVSRSIVPAGDEVTHTPVLHDNIPPTDAQTEAHRDKVAGRVSISGGAG